MKRNREPTVYVQLRAPGADGRLMHCRGMSLHVRGLTPERVYAAVRKALHGAALEERARRHGVAVPESR